MIAQWLWPDRGTFVRVLNGCFRVYWQAPHVATVQDHLKGYHVLRVVFEDESKTEKDAAMENLRSMAEIQYIALKEQHEHTVQNTTHH